MQRSNARTVRSLCNSHLFVATLVLAMFGLAACGGGGGSGSPPPSSPSKDPPSNPPPASAPSVNAGNDQSIELPVNAVELQGSATDSDSTTLTYSWSAAPAEGVTFANPAAAATRVTFTNPGTYELTLVASDGQLTGQDSVRVTVAAAVYPGADQETDPHHGWQAVAPADVGMDAAKLAEAQAYAETGGGSGLISRRGRLVHMWGDIDVRVDLKSTTKSMGGIALGLAMDDNLVALDDLAQSRLPTIGTDPTDPTPNDPALLHDISILHLATHTAGFEKIGSSQANILPELTPIGTKWSYSDSGLNWLADLLTKVFQQDLHTVMTARVWTPLGITSDDLLWRIVTDRPPVDGHAQRTLASGITANPNAMARVGLLFLRKGVWNGQRILSESFIQTASTPRPQIAQATVVNPTGFPNANENYGLLWWTNANRQLPDVPADAYWAWGLGDSLIVVIPSLDLVIARTGNHPDDATLPHWRARWDGNYAVLQPFLTPIVQSVSQQ